MSDDALTMRGPVHGTKDARKVAIGSSVGAVIETYDFICFGTAAALYFGHAFFPVACPIARTLASFATLGVWGNLDTLVNNAGIITINDLEHQRQGFSALLQLRWGTFTQLEAGLPSRRHIRHRAAGRHRQGDPPRPPASVGGGDRPIPNPPHSARPGHQRMTPRPTAQPRTECRCPGRFPDQPVPR